MEAKQVLIEAVFLNATNELFKCDDYKRMLDKSTYIASLVAKSYGFDTFEMVHYLEQLPNEISIRDVYLKILHAKDL